MSKQQPEVHADPDWLELLNERLAEHGQKKVLAEALDVHPSTVTRMAQGKPVRTGLLYRASMVLGIRPPTTLSTDPYQQRLLRALLAARDFLSPEMVERLVAGFEAQVERLSAALDQKQAAIAVIERELGPLQEGDRVLRWEAGEELEVVDGDDLEQDPERSR